MTSPYSAFSHLVLPYDPKSFRGDDHYFARALMKAQYAMGSTHPNPSVGAVLVDDGEIVATGFTMPVGGMHAEKSAIAKARRLRRAELFVTLEPCSHFGRTPPCTDAIITAGIKRVSYGVLDPNPKVLGQGVKALHAAGISVDVTTHPLLRARSQALILPFKKWLQYKKPYVVMKIATSANHKLSDSVGTRSKITGSAADLVVHELRRSMDAIMVGANTVRVDDPQLVARWGRPFHRTQPRRVVVSSDLNLDPNMKIFDTTTAETMIFTDERARFSHGDKFLARGVKIIESSSKDGLVDMDNVLDKMGSAGFTSVLVEAGKTMFRSMVDSRIADEIWWFTAPHKLSDASLDLGHSSSTLANLGYVATTQVKFGEDDLVIYHKVDQKPA